MIQILHNPRCGKSREGLALLEKSGQPFEIIKYLDQPLNATELKVLIEKLKIAPLHLVRQKENIWVENFKERELSDSAIIEVLATFPILMERPIVINGTAAVIGRPVENIANLFNF